MVHGLKPGPALFTENASIVYTFIMSLFVSNIVFVPVGLFIARFCVRLIEIPASILGPLVIGLAVIGSYAINMSMAEVMIMLAIGLIGYLMKFFDVPREPLVDVYKRQPPDGRQYGGLRAESSGGARRAAVAVAGGQEGRT